MTLALIFAPTGMSCSSSTTITGGGTPQPVVEQCKSTSLWQTQPPSGFAPYGVFAIWGLAPLLAVAGTLLRRRSLVIAALVLTTTSFISFGAAMFYAPVVLLLILTLVLFGRDARASA